MLGNFVIMSNLVMLSVSEVSTRQSLESTQETIESSPFSPVQFWQK